MLGATNADFSVPSSQPRVYVPAMTQSLSVAKPDADRQSGNQAIDPDDALAVREYNCVATVMEALHHQSILLSGHPGSGKSTFAQWLVHYVRSGSARPMLAMG